MLLICCYLWLQTKKWTLTLLPLSPLSRLSLHLIYPPWNDLSLLSSHTFTTLPSCALVLSSSPSSPSSPSNSRFLQFGNTLLQCQSGQPPGRVQGVALPELPDGAWLPGWRCHFWGGGPEHHTMTPERNRTHPNPTGGAVFFLYLSSCCPSVSFSLSVQFLSLNPPFYPLSLSVCFQFLPLSLYSFSLLLSLSLPFTTDEATDECTTECQPAIIRRTTDLGLPQSLFRSSQSHWKKGPLISTDDLTSPALYVTSTARMVPWRKKLIRSCWIWPEGTSIGRGNREGKEKKKKCMSIVFICSLSFSFVICTIFLLLYIFFVSVQGFFVGLRKVRDQVAKQRWFRQRCRWRLPQDRERGYYCVCFTGYERLASCNINVAHCQNQDETWTCHEYLTKTHMLSLCLSFSLSLSLSLSFSLACWLSLDHFL